MRKPAFNAFIIHGLLWIFIGLLFVPLYLAFIAASHEGQALMKAPLPLIPGSHLFSNIKVILTSGISATGGEPITRMLLNSLIMALMIALGKTGLALCSAFALVYFKFPGKRLCFGLIFITLMLPIEVRIVPTFQVMASLGWLNTFKGLTFPLMASATATLLFRQYFKTIPNQLVDASKLDGAGPFRFFIDILLPLSRSPMAALFVILFVYGWNQYLWPLLMTTEPSQATIVMGIQYLAGVADQLPEWHYVMTVALIALLPPCLVMILLQRQFEKGLVE